MLEKQGFKHHGHVDPFDGGPYLDVRIDDVPIVKATTTLRAASGQPAGGAEGFVSHKARAGFRATRSIYEMAGDRLVLPAATLESLGAPDGAMVGFTPLPESKAKPRRKKG